MSDSLRPSTAVRLVAQRELNTRLRTRGFLIGTLVILAAIAGYLLLQISVFSGMSTTTVGLTGQATAIAQPLRQAADHIGMDVETRQIADRAEGRAQVSAGELDALVSGSVADLRVLVKSDLDEQLRGLLDGISQQQVLQAKLLEAGMSPQQVLGEVGSTRVEVSSVERPDPERGQRVVVAMVLMFLLYMGITTYGTMVAQGIVEEKSSRVVEILLSTVRPWHLLLGKVIGLGLVGLVQLAVLGVAGLAMASVTGALTITGIATGTLLWGLLWYVLGFFLYATVFAGAGSLVSRQEDMQTVLMPITIVLVGGFISGFTVIQQPDSTAATVLSLIPPLSPILMPSRIATGTASGVEIGLALLLTVATIAALTWLGGRVYRAAVLRTGARVRLKDALRVG
ncbi:ABC-2 type transport system permease protein [Saccharomonospora amisosensis]|uniref:ABC-2 type transport system permease protein n=1 Tax=Saccharomonospora amisosensis TaxID=1128677 RepID=A0A7X5ULR5_9PSEU|nr:ABC transporter permease [Saccharomonospora amisosensis]NIJ10356.1 ABC-2 type transport system permease protein [Saccharomonospora amisosensis]